MTEGQPVSQQICVYWTLFSRRGGHHLTRSQVGLLLSYFWHIVQSYCLNQALRRNLSMYFLLFSMKLVLFRSNFFDLGANFFGIRPFLDFWERFRNPQVFSCKKMALSTFWQEGLSFPRLALRNLHFFLLKMLITATTAVTFLVSAVTFAISSSFVATLRAVSTTLIGRGLCDK